LLFGLVPALTASRASLQHTLASGTLHTAGSRRQSAARRALVVGELAIALVFLTGAGLVAKTFWRVTHIDAGFRPERLIVTGFDLRATRFTNATALAFVESMLERIKRGPGVQSISYATLSPAQRASLPWVGVMYQRPDGTWGESARYVEVDVGPNYFETIGAELIEGRFIGPDDRLGGPRAAVVSESFVRMILKGGHALGRRIGDRLDPKTIVGVIKDVGGAPMEDKRDLAMEFTSLAQRTFYAVAGANMSLQLIVRTKDQPERLQTPIRTAVKSLDAAQAEPTFETVERALAETVAPRRFTLVLLGVFAALAFSLAIIGLYSGLAYLVAERTREIGIRMAVGADRARVTRMILGHGLRLTMVGTMLGAGASIVVVRVLRAWMYEMSVYDAPTFAAVAVLLCIVALIASWLPARRASRVDPILALRAD
jgi:predicted permease